MNVRSLILVAAALIIAVVTALLARSLMSGTSETPAPAAASRKVAETKVLVAARSLPAGTILKTDDLKWQPWPEDAVTDILIREGSVPLGDMAGKVLRTALLAGQPVPQDAAVGPKERGFLAAVLSPGMRAITVSLSPTTGVGGFVFPGDRVDLVVTHEVERGDSRLEVAETVIRNVRVLAIDQATANEDNQPRVGATATLEVTPKQVEKINIMDQLGDLSLSLRPLADTEDTVDADGRIIPAPPSDHAPSFTTASEVTRFAGARAPSGGGSSGGKAAAPRRPAVVVVRGNQASMAETGAE